MRVLHLEDALSDAELVGGIVRGEWPRAEIRVVDSRAALIAALDGGSYDVFLSDFRVPDIEGLEALALMKQRQPDVPVIFVSGTIGEEQAAQLVRAGAADYLIKDRMRRLPLAIHAALQEANARRLGRAADQRLREQARLLDEVGDAIVVTSLAGEIVYWNRVAEQIFEGQPTAIAGKHMGELLGPGVEGTLRAAEPELAAKGEWRGEISYVAAGGNRPVLLDVRITTVKDAVGQPVSRLHVITDVTERRQMEEQLLRAHRLESLGMLAAGIAHDLNNALAPMLMGVGLLRSRMSNPADLRLIELLDQSAHRGAALVKQIVSFAGGRNRDLVLVQPRHLLRDIMQLVQDTFPKSIRVELMAPNQLWTVRGNPTQLHQIMLNLCINARDAMPNGGVLSLRCDNVTLSEAAASEFPDALPGRYVLIEVGDSGVGIPPDVLSRIWDPFFTTKPEGQGTGLGLSVVRGIVSNHGGFTSVSSELGKGAVFRIYLPAEIGSAETQSTGAPDQVRQGLGELVLVVDDQVTVRESICAVLAQNGYRFISVHDGIEALTRYADRIREIAVVITDLDMPGVNGVVFAHAALRLNPSVKVLFISGTGDPDGSAPTVPGAEFLSKPFSGRALLEKLAALLGGRG